MAFISLQDFGFSGHETFPIRYGWLTKGIDSVMDDRYIFSAPDAIVRLGVGKNMVRGINHWCLVSGLVSEVRPEKGRTRAFEATPLGKLVFGPHGYDRYMEQQATLWLIHWQIASSIVKATTWYCAFSYLNQPEFTKEDIFRLLIRAMENSGRESPKVSHNTIRRDVDCFIRTYVARKGQPGIGIEDSLECPLSELGLISQGDDPRFYRINDSGQNSLPDCLFAYAVVDYWQRYFPDRASLTLEQLAYQPGSPGRLFRLSPQSMACRLERIHSYSDSLLSYSESAGIRQVFMDKDIDKLTLIDECYRQGGR